MSLLEVQNLKTYIRLRSTEVKAVDGVTFSVEAGESVGLVGESGCGKTMTGMSIMQLLPSGGYIADGKVLFGGRDLAKASEPELRKIRGHEIGMIFQDPMTSLNPAMEIGEQIAESVRLHLGYNRKQATERVKEVLGLVGMPNPAERLAYYPHQLSGGLRQRVMIAMALACEPKLLIADEPTTALDVTIQAQILSLLDDLRTELKMAMLLITHDMGVIAGRADKVVVMYAGKIAEEAETVEMFEDHHHPYTEALLSSIPPMDSDAPGRLYSIQGLPPDLTNPPKGCRFAARCSYAQPDCIANEPPLETHDHGHRYACFHPVTVKDTVVATREKRIVRDESGREILMSLKNVSKEFEITKGAILQRKLGTLQAVSDFSLDIYRGETIGLVGESGCGKTTTGSMMVALERPTRGIIEFNGTDLGLLRGHDLRTKRRDLQLMFQDPYASLDPRMRVGTIIKEPLDIANIGTSAEREEKVLSLLNEVGLSSRAVGRYPHEFSGGQRQRIGLARALALNPKLIVADEPVSALDVSIRSQVLNLMKDLQETHNLTYVVISHDLSVVRYLADRVGVMYLGKLVEIGSGTEVYDSPAHPYTAALLSAVPVANPSFEKKKTREIVVGELPSAINPPSGCRFRTRCPLAQEICATEEPPLRSFGGTHEAACHFPLQDPVRKEEFAHQG